MTRFTTPLTSRILPPYFFWNSSPSFSKAADSSVAVNLNSVGRLMMSISVGDFGRGLLAAGAELVGEAGGNFAEAGILLADIGVDFPQPVKTKHVTRRKRLASLVLTSPR